MSEALLYALGGAVVVGIPAFILGLIVGGSRTEDEETKR